MACALLMACGVPQHPVPERLDQPAGQSPELHSSAHGPVPLVIEGENGPVHVLAEVANTPVARARGLMYRESLEAGKGMIFVYEKRDVHTFWMKNTLIPLDMLFLDGPPHLEFPTVIGIVHDAEPESLTHRSVPAPSLYVLEVPGGWSRKMGVSVGSRVSWKNLPEALKPSP